MCDGHGKGIGDLKPWQMALWAAVVIGLYGLMFWALRG
jgi:hypothetical protein